MYSGGNVTIFVADMDRSVEFYTKVLGLELRVRYGNHWAEVKTPQDLVIGLHPASPGKPVPGTIGAMQVGLHLSGTLDDAMDTLSQRGVAFGDTVSDEGVGRFAYFEDPDGNPIYLWEAGQHVKDVEAGKAEPMSTKDG